ncbi:MAG: hypothetical protein ACXVRH_10610 [Thermoleophilaceae bacterium]
MGALRDRVRYAGNDVRCPCCEGRFGRFKETTDGPQCPRCGSKPRQRLLWLFLSAEGLLAAPPLRVLGIGNERCIEQRLLELGGVDYVPGDVSRAPFDRILSSRLPSDGPALDELRAAMSPQGVSVFVGGPELELSLAEAGFRVRAIRFAEEMDEAAARRHGVLPSGDGASRHINLCQLPR